MLFQDKKDNLLKNGWRNGPVYVVEINLTEESEPLLLVSRFEYYAIREWSEGCSPASYWAFMHPLRDEQLAYTEIGDINLLTLPETEEAPTSKDYWCLKRILYKKFLLAGVTSENVVTAIFETFDELAHFATQKNA